MQKSKTSFILLGIAGLAAAAQIAIAQPPPPPAPPADSAPVAVPAPEPVPVVPDVPVEEAVERAVEAVHRIKPHIAGIKPKLDEMWMRMDEARMKFDLEMSSTQAMSSQMQEMAAKMALLAQAQPPQPPQAPHPVPMPGKFRYSERDSEERLYRNGTRHLDRREYDQAVEAFDAATQKKGPKADGAYYWKAYALAKLGRRDESLAVIAELQKLHPNSRWLNDSKALAAEVRRASGQPATPDAHADEDIKLMAINALMNSDPESAIPLLEKVMARGGSSPKLQERALFVLAQSRSPQARQIVTDYAKGKGNPDLQVKAVEYLGMQGGRDTVQILGEIYGTTNDPNLKRRILQSFMQTRDKDRLFAAAKSETNPDLRREAIQLLGAMNAITELGQLYSSETSVEVKETILHALFAGGAHDRLIELARTERDPKLRRQAINQLGAMRRSGPAADALVSIYGTETEPQIKQQILNSLFAQGNVTKIIELARKETDPKLKREAVERLSHMKSKEATEFLMELLNK
jgi:TolA-binding protein